jgi:hypothetical protein
VARYAQREVSMRALTLLTFAACGGAGPTPWPDPFSDCRAADGDPYDIGPSGGAEDPVVVVGHELRVTVGYSGGCEEHAFQICWDGSFMESDPVQARIDLLHDANGDGCEAYVTDELSFDLNPMRLAWQSYYGGSGGEIILRLRERSATYRFED